MKTKLFYRGWCEDEYNASMEDTFTVFYVMDDTNDSSHPFYFESTNLPSMKMVIASEVDPSMPVVHQRKCVYYYPK